MGRWQPQDRWSVVTGASSGIGYQLALRLASRGSHVLAVARREDRLAALRNAVPPGQGEIVPIAGDITAASLRQEVLRQVQMLGRLDLLVNAAGIGGLGSFAQSDEERLRRIFEVNFFGATELTRALLPWLRRGREPVICNIGSVLGHCAAPRKSEYCASKFALHGWSDALRAELASEGIQVTLVSPSTTRTEFFEAALQSQESAVPVNAWGSKSPEAVAEIAYRAICARRREVIVSTAGKLVVWLDRLSPPLMARILRSMMPSPRSDSHATNSEPR